VPAEGRHGHSREKDKKPLGQKRRESFIEENPKAKTASLDMSQVGK